MARDGGKMMLLKKCQEAYYDGFSDIFFVGHALKAGDRFKQTLGDDANDVYADMSERGECFGIEIWNAAPFFRNRGISEDVLAKLSDAEFSARMADDGVHITLVLENGPLNRVSTKIIVPLDD